MDDSACVVDYNTSIHISWSFWNRYKWQDIFNHIDLTVNAEINCFGGIILNSVALGFWLTHRTLLLHFTCKVRWFGRNELHLEKAIFKACVHDMHVCGPIEITAVHSYILSYFELLSNRTMKFLIRLRGCASWSGSLRCAYIPNRLFSK